MDHNAVELVEAQYKLVISVGARRSEMYDDVDKARMRERIYRVVETAFTRAEIARDAVHMEDRGDGVVLAVASRIAVSQLLGRWTVELHENLREENRGLRVPLGLRIGMHVGPVTPDAYGFSGRAVDLACRLADSAVARQLLDAEGGDLVLVISDYLYEVVVSGGGKFIEPARYAPARLPLKEGEVTAWFHLPGRAVPAIPAAALPSAAREAKPSAVVHFTVHGDMSQSYNNTYQRSVHVGRIAERDSEGPSDVLGGPPLDRLSDDEFQRPSGQTHGNDALPPLPPAAVPNIDGGSTDPRSLVAELPEQASPGREVPLHVQIVQGSSGRGVQLRSFSLPRVGARLLVTIHAPGLVAIDELQQELHVVPGRDSDVLLFRLKAPMPGLHQVTVRAFRGGTFLGEVICQISVGHGSVTRDGPQHQAPLPSMAFDPGEVTLQVLKDESVGTFSFQLISETFYPTEVFRFRGGDPRQATEQIYAELRRAAKDAANGEGDGNALRLRSRLRSHGSQLWTSAVPQAVQSQFWDEAEAGHVKAFTVLGEHDIIPWELLYPLNEGHQERGFLAEWLPVVRRVFGQDRVRSLSLPGMAFVVPPGSPTDTGEEVTSLRARLGAEVADIGVLTERAALTDLIEGGHAGLLHFACHNAFTGTGSCVTMADGPFDPIDLAPAAQLRTLRPHHPLVFFNACRSAGEIDWFGESLGWAPQFLNAGAGAFVGTLWPVRSRSALQFAEAFYDQLITHHQTLGQASLVARQTIRDLHGGDPTWLAYAVYGSPAATAHTIA
ncbi:CHAT domain-containing protein [Streptomyces canus]|uniref:CHAT domain-containing protein n=1 Tax=Streptomyces canus TaxID=58343 RepID=UPI002255C738|nr:CHAT domain-containing protein [Streptomyces canus]MCX5262274.1 CHAT domain-containing protein [Streptomyces canus]